MGWLPGNLQRPFNQTWNALQFLYQNPCNETYLAYAETAFPPVGDMVMQLLTFDACDILRCIFRPENLPSGSKRRKGKRGKGFPTNPANIPEYLCDKFVPKGDLPNRPVTQGVRHLWAIDAAFQKASFWFMMMDLVHDDIIAWASMLERTEQCRLAFGGTAYGRAGEGPATGTGNLWRNVAFEHQEHTGNGYWVGNAGAAVPAVDCTVGGAVVLIPAPPSFTPYPWRARLTLDNLPIATTDIADGTSDDPNKGFVFSPIRTQGGVFAMQLDVFAGLFEFMILKQAYLFADGGGRELFQLPSMNQFLCGVPGMLGAS
jgi:hypothetical protein